MDIKMLTRGLAYVVLLGALLATAIAFNNRQYPVESLRTEPSPTSTVVDIKLAHCNAIGSEAASDTICQAMWDAGRKRFLESKKLDQDRVSGAVPGTSGLIQPALRSEQAPQRGAPQLPSTHNSSARYAPTDAAGQLQ